MGLQIKILIYTEAWGGGGIETFVMNVVRRLQGDVFQFDIFSTWDWPGISDEELIALGINRTCVFKGKRPGQVTRLVRGVSEFGRLLRITRYDAVWINTMNGMGFLYAREAKRLGVPVRVVHSHNSDVGEGMRALKRVVGRIGGALWGDCSTANIACSRAAGEYLFGRRAFKVINNGIDTERFRFSSEKRRRIRTELGISDETVLVGSIGRIADQKNPIFQIDVFAEYKKLVKASRYLMVGKGDMVDEVLLRMEELGLRVDDVIIREPVKDPSPYYCALDAFLMPSFFEGLGIAKVEAQCSGLPVLASHSLPREADITNLVNTCDLKESAECWAKKLMKLINGRHIDSRVGYADAVAQAGYSVESAVLSVRDVFAIG